MCAQIGVAQKACAVGFAVISIDVAKDSLYASFR